MSDEEKPITPEMQAQAREAMLGMFRDCAGEDEKVACVAGLLEDVPPEVQVLCQPRILLLTNQEGTCDACEEAKKDFAPMIAAGIVTEKKIYLGDGLRIARKNEIKTAPSLVVVDCNDNVLVDLS